MEPAALCLRHPPLLSSAHENQTCGGSATLIITEKNSQVKNLRAALGDRFGRISPAEGHLLRLAEPDEVNTGWKSLSCVLLKPDSLYPTRPAREPAW